MGDHANGGSRIQGGLFTERLASLITQSWNQFMSWLKGLENLRPYVAAASGLRV